MAANRSKHTEQSNGVFWLLLVAEGLLGGEAREAIMELCVRLLFVSNNDNHNDNTKGRRGEGASCVVGGFGGGECV